jgi:hypothetical protein
MTAFTADISLDFTVRGNATSYMKDGWSSSEERETWTVGPRARLILPAPKGPTAYVLRLELRPHVQPGRLALQRLHVVVNEQVVARFSVARRTVRACTIPWELLAGRAETEVAFDVPDAASPSDDEVSGDTRQLGVALSNLQLYADVHASRQTDGQPRAVDFSVIMRADLLPLNQLMLNFESLGQNCEFGLVQRQCKAEPLGLLRFSSTPLSKLLAALEARFDGLGAPGSMRAELSANGREYMINDGRFGFLYHAFVDAGAMTPEDLRRREERRVPFLVNKLLENLEVGDKIFVFKGMGAMEEEEVFPLAMAIRRYGPNTLLFINLANDQNKGGSVAARAPGFYVGYLDRFAPGDDAAGFDLAQWVQVCRMAYRLKLARDH